jgi:hypothetical protein
MKKTIFFLAVFAAAPLMLLSARGGGGGGGGHGGGGYGGGSHADASHFDAGYRAGENQEAKYNNDWGGGGVYDSGYDPAYWDATVNYQPNQGSQPGMSDDSNALYRSYVEENGPPPPAMGS